MFEDFDSLFNRYFGNRDDEDEHMKKMKKLVDRLNNFDDVTGDAANNLQDRELGEPDEEIYFEENGYSFKKSVWNIEGGSIVKVEMVSSPLDNMGREPRHVKRKLSLQDQLELAVKEERYEDAAKLRDEIATVEESTNLG